MKESLFQFKPEDFRDAICIGEMSGVLDRIARDANQILAENMPDLQSSHSSSKLIEISDNLRPLCSKLRAIGYFFETQNADHQKPIDADKVNLGISLIIEDIGKSLSEIADCAESANKNT